MQFLQALDLVVPSTFSQWQSGNIQTWQHSGGKQSRLDYVAISCALSHALQHAWVDQRIDTASEGCDHRPIQRKAKRYNDRALLAAQGKTAATAALRSVFSLDWKVHPDAHFDTVMRELHQKLADALSATRSNPRKSFVQDSTWAYRQSTLCKLRVFFALWREPNFTAC